MLDPLIIRYDLLQIDSLSVCRRSFSVTKLELAAIRILSFLGQDLIAAFCFLVWKIPRSPILHNPFVFVLTFFLTMNLLCEICAANGSWLR